MARLGRGFPNHVTVVRAPLAGVTTATGTLAVTLGAVTISATGTAGGIAGGSANGVANMVPVMSGRGPVAVGGNVVRVLQRTRR